MPSEKPCILLIRPSARLANDLAICEQANCYGIGFSPIDLVVNQPAIEQFTQDYPSADAVFWVSPSAVELAPHVSDNGKPQIAVGKATAQALAKRGFSQIICPLNGQDSEAVAKLPLWQTLSPQSRVLIVRGQNGREWLGHFLHKQGFHVQYAEIYQRVKQYIDWKLFFEHKPQIAWVASSEMVQEMFHQAPPEITQALQSLLYLTHHARIANVLQFYNVKRVELIETFNLPALQRYTELNR